MGPVLLGQKFIIVPKGMKVGPQLVQQASRPRLCNGMLTLKNTTAVTAIALITATRENLFQNHTNISLFSTNADT
jgi:hypothetical protein